MKKLDDIEQRKARIVPTVVGARAAWLALEGPVHAPSLSGKPVPPRRWMVEDLMPEKAVTMFAGDGGSGKSTLALQLACSAVLGRPWLGRSTKSCKVVYLSCEDELDEVHRRLDAISSHEDWDLSDLDGLEIFDRVGRENAVMYRGDKFGAGWEPTPFWCSFTNWFTDFGAGLLIMDSLYDFFPGNQLDMSAARHFMGMLRETAKEADASVLLLSHPSKSGMETGDGTSGSVAFRNAGRAMIYLEKDKDFPDAPLILRGKKANYGPAAGEVAVKWDQGRFVPVAVDCPATGIFGAIERRNVEAAFLYLLDKLEREGRPVSPSLRANNFAPAIFANRPDNAGYKKSDFVRAMETLFSEQEITTVSYGRASDERRKIVRCGGD